MCSSDLVAVAFGQLRQQGKVREFGVSNFRPAQLTALQRTLAFPLVVNQVEISLANLVCFNDGTLDQCLAERITPMAWSPLAGGLLAEGARRLLPSQENYRVERVVLELDALARVRGSTRGTVALAWLLTRPGMTSPIIGATKLPQLEDAIAGAGLKLPADELKVLDEAYTWNRNLGMIR